MKKTQSHPRSVPKQSDIVIHPGGEVSVSFLWDDFGRGKKQNSGKIIQLKRPKVNPVLEERVDSFYLNCKMCPKECCFNRMKAPHPRCGGNEIRIGTWGCTFGDEPEIVGQGGSGAILFSHCPLSCPSCHNPEMVSKGTEVLSDKLIDICYRLYEEGAENIQLLSPTVHMPKLELVLKVLKQNHFPLPIVFKSSGNESLTFLKRMKGLVDVYLPDFKYGVHSEFAKRAGCPDYFLEAKETIREMIKQVGPPRLSQEGILLKGVLIRHVMAPIPEPERKSIFDFLDKFKNQCLVSVMDNFVNLE